MNALGNPSPLIDVATAREIAAAQVGIIGPQRHLTLSSALGHVCARDVIASGAMPFFTNSAVDGYAVRHADVVSAGLSLPVAGTVAAGMESPALPHGAVLRIFTGAPLPQGADTVVALEDVQDSGGGITLASIPGIGANIRQAGSDQPLGACLVARGTLITPRHVGLLAANGIERVAVVRKPRVAVVSTGDELVGDGPRGEGQIHDANRPMLLALAAQAGCDVLDAGIMPDEPDPLALHLADLATRVDLVLSSGGVSMGGRDPLRPAFLAAGGEMAAWRVALKPGKPVMFGRIGATAFTGLPGNPMAAFVGFHLFALPQIARLTGSEPAPFAPAKGRAEFSWHRRPGRREVFPVRCLGLDETGLPRLERLGNGVSGTLFPLAHAEGLAVVPASCEGLAPGDILHWQPFCAGA